MKIIEIKKQTEAIHCLVCGKRVKDGEENDIHTVHINTTNGQNILTFNACKHCIETMKGEIYL